MSTTATLHNHLDTRLNICRPDLAAECLRGQVDAEQFVEGRKVQVRRPLVPMRERPDPNAPITNEILFGENVWVYEEKEGWAWCQLDRDQYVGYVPAGPLAAEIAETTHRVSALGTFVYQQADIKSAPLFHLPLGAQLAITGGTEHMCELATGGYITKRHIKDKMKFTRDFVELAERLLDTPYLWGGRSRIGIDCSGLVQVTMEAAGLDCPRDSDMQCEKVGTDVLIPEDLTGLQRGDLVFWPGHVGIMSDGIMLVHANAHHMAVVTEPLITAAQRIEKAGSRIIKIKRPPALAV